MGALAEAHLPVYDVSDAVAVVVDADRATTWRALLEADLLEVGRRKPLVAALGAVRVLPEALARLLHGQGLPPRPEQLTLEGSTGLPAAAGGWVLLGRDDALGEIALGLVGRFWLPVIRYADVPAAAFRDFDEPGYAKTVYALEVEALDDGRTLLSAVMRTATTSDDARRWFRRYWTLGVGSGAHVLVHGLLDVVRETAEDAAVQAGAIPQEVTR